MGTIVDKFNYSFEAKDLIKDSINNLGGSITSETELKEYAQELDNIYDNLPKTTGEGTNLSLTTLKGKMNIQVKGDTQQDGTPTPDTPINIEVVTGTQEVTISNSDNTETQTQTLSLGDIELCKIGNYQDYLYKSNDKWYKKEYIGKVVLNGSENWVTRSGATSYAYAVTNFLPQNASNGLCNYWKFILGGAGGSQANECIASANTTTALNIFTNNTNLNSVANLKTWLGTNTPIVYFNREVANDIEITNETLIEQLDNLEKLKSYNSTTNISSSGSLPMILNVSALKGE